MWQVWEKSLVVGPKTAHCVSENILQQVGSGVAPFNCHQHPPTHQHTPKGGMYLPLKAPVVNQVWLWSAFWSAADFCCHLSSACDHRQNFRSHNPGSSEYEFGLHDNSASLDHVFKQTLNLPLPERTPLPSSAHHGTPFTCFFIKYSLKMY